jgi:hypothetical protein
MKLVKNSNSKNVILNLPELPTDYYWQIRPEVFEREITFLSIELQKIQYERLTKNVTGYTTVTSRSVQFIAEKAEFNEIGERLVAEAKKIHETHFASPEDALAVLFLGVYEPVG